MERFASHEEKRQKMKWRILVAALGIAAIVSPAAISSSGADQPILARAAASRSFPGVAPRYQRLMEVSSQSVGVPAVIPAGGVEILGPPVNGADSVLFYIWPADPEPGAMSPSAAASAALALDNAPGLKVTNLVYGAVTDPSSVPPVGTTPPASAVINTAAWIVTVTAPQPVNMGPCLLDRDGSAACTTDMVTANVMVLDPTSGSLLDGQFL